MNIEIHKHKLKNGLTLLVSEKKDTPMVSVNILYKVGARDEDNNKTGMAHLFEHLMFGGSINIPSYDEPLQEAGGENNAFTNNDITNYYLTLPASNIETAFWLESDRMLSLAFTEKSLTVQKNVVIEEFKQRYLNQPYGDAMAMLRKLIYKKHPYKYSTIGKKISHIDNVVLDDIKNFFYKHYGPNNAILSVVGNVKFKEIIELTEKWFGDIENRNIKASVLPTEDLQRKRRFLEVKRDVPINALYMAFLMPKRNNPDYYAMDLISDILGNGKSSRLYKELIDNKQLFSDINCYISGNLDKGFLIIEGKIMEQKSIIEAEQAVNDLINNLITTKVDIEELQKVKNKVESSFLFQNIGISQLSMNIAYFEMLGDANMIKSELNNYRNVSKMDIKRVAKKYLSKNRSCVLHYLKNN